MTPDDLSVGQTVEWRVRQLMGDTRPVQGTIREMNVARHGHDDIIVCECPTDPSGEAEIRPEDVVRIVG